LNFGFQELKLITLNIQSVNYNNAVVGEVSIFATC